MTSPTLVRISGAELLIRTLIEGHSQQRTLGWRQDITLKPAILSLCSWLIGRSFWGASLPRGYRSKSTRSYRGCVLLSAIGVPTLSEWEPSHILARGNGNAAL